MVRYSRLLVSLLLLLVPTAWAATYNLQTTFPNGCAASGTGQVSCPSGLTLNWGDIVETNGPVTISVNGNASLSNAQINMERSYSVTIQATGNITTNQAKIRGDLTSSGDMSIGYQTHVYGSLNGRNITTNSQVHISGSVAGEVVTLGSQNTVQGSVYGSTSVTLLSEHSTYHSSVSSAGPVVLYSHITIHGAVSGSSVTPAFDGSNYVGSNVTIYGNVSVVNEFVWPDKSKLFGNVTAGNVVIQAANADITGNVTSYADIIIHSKSGITGNATASHLIQLLSDLAYITGNATAGEEIIIGWAGSIGGDATAPHIQNESGQKDPVGGGEYCDSSKSDHNVSHAFSCSPITAPGDGSSSPGIGEFCAAIYDAAGYGIIGDTKFDYGNNSIINGNRIEGDEGNTPTPSGQLAQVDLTYPLNTPPSFPVLNGGADKTNPQDLPPSHYNTVLVSGKVTSASTSGGTYYIRSLNLTHQGSHHTTLNLAPGDYFIGSMSLGNNISINVRSPGQVRLFIRDGLVAGNNIFLNSTGTVDQLAIYLYDGADFDVGNYNQGHSEFVFTGLIYSPYANTHIKFGNNNNIKGGIISKGTVTVGNNTNIDYSSEVQAAIIAAAGCTPLAPEVHHYRILHPTSTVACYGAPVTIKACADEQCTATYNDAVELTVTSSVASSRWQGGAKIGGSDASAELLFDQGAGTSGLHLISGGTTSLSLSQATPTALESTQCYDSSGVLATSCQIDFNPAGLLIVGDDSSNSAPILPQFAGNNTAFNTRVRAVQTNTTTGACEARLTGPQQLQVGLECLNPSLCQAEQQYTIAGTPIPLNAAGSAIQRVTLNVQFDATGTAVLPNNTYSDVGMLRLHATLPLTEGTNTPPGVPDPAITLTGQSINDFVVKPYRLLTAAVDDNIAFVVASGLAPQPVFKQAGEPFNVIVQGQNSHGGVTPNFGNEFPTTTVTAGFHSMVFPNPAATDSNASKFESGSFTPAGGNSGHFIGTNNRWLEAGTFNLQAAAIDYLGMGDAYERPPVPTGRFIPAAFVVDPIYSSVGNSCSTGFTYMGEPKIPLHYRVQAVNTQGGITKNYDSARYAQANAETAALSVLATHLNEVSTDEFGQRLSVTNHQQWVDGTLTVSDLESAFLRHPDPLLIDGPYPMLRFGLQVASQGLDAIGWHDGQELLVSPQGTAAEIPGSINVRYGRAVLEDVYGPDTENLAILMRHEYFDGNGFVTHSDDSCASFQRNDFQLVDNPQGLATELDGALTGTLIQGELPQSSLWWTAPRNAGEILFQYNAPSWLQFDWDQNGTLTGPSAIGGFGQYRGNDRIIFWLEQRH